MVDKTREIALKILYKIDKEGAYSNIALNEELDKNKQLDSRDVGLISEIVYGVTNWKLSIDTIIEKYSKIKIKKISPWIINIIRMGIYQIIWLDKIPKSASVNESVNLAKRYGHQASSNFVNAILRKITKHDYEELSNISNPQERLSKVYSMPMWLVQELLKERKSFEVVQDICEELNKRPQMSIRRNNLKIGQQEFETELEKNKIKFKNSNVNNDFYIIEGIRNIEGLELFKKGYFTVQDISAGLSAYLLNPKQGETILDACSAPGGKTTYLAEIMQNKGKIEAWDIYKHRTKLVEENAKRLGISIIDTKEKDATKYDIDYNQKFDKILLDVPCLGLGVIKRKPDIKWQRKPEDIEEITKIQKEILETCSNYLKPRGIMVYSTCSILKKENQDVIKHFLKQHKEFKIIEQKKFTENLQTEKNQEKNSQEKNDGMLEILPKRDQDGFFICTVQKI